MKKFIAFFEIPTVDFHRAVDFYETVFGVQLPVFECEEEKMACFTEEGSCSRLSSFGKRSDYLF